MTCLSITVSQYCTWHICNCGHAPSNTGNLMSMENFGETVLQKTFGPTTWLFQEIPCQNYDCETFLTQICLPTTLKLVDVVLFETPLLTSKGSVFLLSEVPVWSFTQNTKQPNATLSRIFSSPPPLSTRFQRSSPIWKRLEKHAFPFFELSFQTLLLWLLKHGGAVGYRKDSAKKGVVAASSNILALI